MRSIAGLVPVFVLGVFVACSSSTTTVTDTPSGGGDDASTAGDDDGGPSGSDASDGPSRPTEDILVDVTRPASPALSCAAFCASEQYTCVTSCSLGEDAGVGAGDAVYGDSFSGITSVVITSCTDVPKASVSGGPSGTQSLNNYECCCRSPKHQKIEGTLPAKTCNEVCAAHGLKCDDFTIWDGADTTTYQGGAHASYDDGGATSFANAGCDAVPAPTHKQGTLVGYECGCF